MLSGLHVALLGGSHCSKPVMFTWLWQALTLAPQAVFCLQACCGDMLLLF